MGSGYTLYDDAAVCGINFQMEEQPGRQIPYKVAQLQLVRGALQDKPGPEAVFNFRASKNFQPVIQALADLFGRRQMNMPDWPPVILPEEILAWPRGQILQSHAETPAILAVKKEEDRALAIVVWSQVSEKWSELGSPRSPFGSSTPLPTALQGTCMAFFNLSRKAEAVFDAVIGATTAMPRQSGLPRAYHDWLKRQP